MKYWLMKSEPEAFSIQDLKKRKREPWDGVRNYQARNFMRNEMQIGDLVLFYHSNAEPSGVAGIAKIATVALPDPTQFEPGHVHFDPKSNPDDPRWWLVNVAFVEEFARVISLAELREYPELANMGVLRKGQRLSIMPITESEFLTIRTLGAVTK